MGTSASSPRGAGPGARAAPGASGAGAGAGAGAAPAPGALFRVLPLRELLTLGDAPLALRLDAECLSLLDEGGAVALSWPYHRVLCWGYTAETFQWRVCASADDVDAEAAAAAARATAADFARDPGAAGAAGAAAAAAVAHPAPAPPAPTMTFQVATPAGRDVEAALMRSVHALMDSMAARGVGAAEFGGVVAALRALAEDGLTDQALGALRQLTLGRAFDSRQAAAVLDALGAVSPFDKVEAACALYPHALLHPTALPSLLREAFADAQDIDNVLHRLGLVVTASDTVEQAPTVASRASARRAAAA